MAASSGKPRLATRLRHGFRTYRAWVDSVVLGAGAVLTVLALGYFTPLSSAWPFTVINPVTNTPSANWNLVFVILGPILLIAGGYLLGTYIVARRRFEHLMVTKSKAEFIRNIPEIEDLLWDLKPVDEIRYERKKAELRIRR